MGQPEQADPLAQSSTEAAKKVIGRPFQKGQSGNPSGRAKGIARQAREAMGENGELVINFWAGVVTGEVLTSTSTIDPKTGKILDTVYEMTPVTVADRIRVSQLLAERGFGKPAEFVPIEDDDPLGLADAEDASIAESLRNTVVELAERRRARDATDEPAAADGS